MGRRQTHERDGNGHVRSRPDGVVRYAAIGLGYISQDAVLPAFFNARNNSQLCALVTDDPLKAKRLSRKYNVSKTYTYEQYDHCLRSGEVDAVYIALPNSMHCEYAVAAAKAGIHVLCEKPMALNASECQAMISSATENGVKLMIGYRLHFESANLRAIEWVRTGKIGNPRLFSSVFSQQVPAENIRLDRSLGGGPLWDIGIYCINAARYLFEAEPAEVFAQKATGDDRRFRDVEESVSAILRFPNDRLATFACSFGASDVSEYQVVGTKGNVRVDPAYDFVKGLKLSVTIDGKVRESMFPRSDQFAPELVYFSDCILNNRDPEPSGTEGLADVRIIQSMFESLEKRRPIRIKPAEIEARPSMKQEIHRPPNARPEMVHAQSPSR